MSLCTLSSAFFSSVIGLHDARRNSSSLPSWRFLGRGMSGMVKGCGAGRNWYDMNGCFFKNKKDEPSQYKLERVPFLEEQVRKIKETGKLLTMDVERLLLSEDNHFDFINEVAAEANEYVRTIGMSMEALRKQSFI